MTRRLAPVIAALLMALSALPAAALPVMRNFTLQAQRNDYPAGAALVNYSSCWSYIHSDGREYAVIGVNGTFAGTGGTAIYNVTDPALPHLVGLITGPNSPWREFKSYRDWIYVVSEGSGPGLGLQIVRMTNPESPVLAATYTTTFSTAHTVSVDTTRGILICNGTKNSGLVDAGMHILALNNPGLGATPEFPVELSWWPGGSLPVPPVNYVHDSVPVGNRLYAASIYPGIERVLDFTNPAAPTQIVAWTYPGGFTHNSWPDATGNWLYVTDEINGEPLKVFDLSTLGSPVLRNAITSNPNAIVHNAHVRGGELYLSNYSEGIRALDLSDPAHPAEFASADSYPGASGGYNGVWEVCPFFPSGTVIASDRNTGLYIYRPVRDYGIIRAQVINGGAAAVSHACGMTAGSCCCAPNPCTCGMSALPGSPIPQIKVTLTTQGDSLTTPADGIVQFAPGPGSHTVLAHQFGFYDASAAVNVTLGGTNVVTLPLVERPSGTFAGIVRSSVSGLPLDGSEVSLAYTHVHQHTGPSGAYSLNVPDDIYRLQVRCAGYVPLDYDRRIGPQFPGEDFSLVPAAFWDDLQTDTGWATSDPGDDAGANGRWTRVVPTGTGPRPPASAPPPGPNLAARAADRRGAGLLSIQHEEPVVVNPNMQPYADHTPGAGTMCFVTGNSPDTVNVEAADVDAGKTSLTTPALNTSGMTDPVIGYWRWFASFFPAGISSGNNGPEPFDYMAVLISNDNGSSWASVDTLRGLANHWEEGAIHVSQFVTPTAQVKVRFVAADGGLGSTVEGAIDDLTLYDAALQPVSVPPRVAGNRLAFRAPWPNPASGEVSFMIDLPEAVDLGVEVVDLQGRHVRELHRGMVGIGALTLRWDGRDDSGRVAPAGLYFARAAAGAEHSLARFVRIR